MKHSIHDAIVIGGGPGGAVCARLLAKRGNSVVLLERGAEGRYKSCAGGIPLRNSQITPIDEAVVQRRIMSMRTIAPNLSQFETARDRLLGHVVFRSDYDTYLRGLAQEAGAIVLLSTKVTNIEVSADRVRVTTQGGAREETLSARVVVGAFGMSPRPNLFRCLGVRQPDHLVSVALEIALDEDVVEQRISNTVEAYIDSRITKTGAAWLYPKRAGANVGLMSYRKSSGKAFAKKLLDLVNDHPVMSSKCRGWRPLFGDTKKSLSAHLIPFGKADRSYGDRFVLVGDAAGAADPLSGEGIFHAQLTGKIAAQVLSRQLVKDALGAADLHEYEARWHKALFEEETKYTKSLAGILCDYPHVDDLFNAVVDTSIQSKAAWRLLSDIHVWIYSGERSGRQVRAAAARRLGSLLLAQGVAKRMGLAKSLALLKPAARHFVW